MSSKEPVSRGASESNPSTPDGAPFPIVGIGASAAGLGAFGQLLRALPRDTGMAFVLVQHVGAQEGNTANDLFADQSSMPVVPVVDATEVRPNHVYVIPPNATMVLQEGQIRLTHCASGYEFPIDTFFGSLAAEQGGRAIGVVLSRDTPDGSEGLRAISSGRGITFAQDESASDKAGPQADFVLPPSEIGRELGILAAREARDYAEALLETVRQPLVVLNSDLRVRKVTEAFCETFRVSRAETEGRLFHDLGNGQWKQPRLRELLGRALFEDEPLAEFEVQHEFQHLGRRTMRLNARRIPLQHRERMLLVAIEDVSKRREEAETRFQRLFETAQDAMAVLDAETGEVLDVNPAMVELTGFAREEIVRRLLPDSGPFREMPEAPLLTAQAKEHNVFRYDTTVVGCNGGGRVAVEVVGNLYHLGGRPVVQLNVRDITARQQAENALRESEERFRLFVDSVRDYALFQIDVNGKIESWNDGAERLLRWREAEAIGCDASLVFTPEDVAAGEHIKEMETALSKGRAEDERWHMRKDGTRFFASGVLTPVYDDDGQLHGFAKVMRDVTERKEQAERLQRSHDEKIVLLREVHHRVKNNLQLIVSLLSVQANHSTDPVVANAFEETESRVRAIASIHERLYASDDLSEVEFGAYLTQLVRELLILHRGDTVSVELDLRVEDMVVSIEQAVPLGLIANELILNSLKHALGRKSGLPGRGGRLSVMLTYDPSGLGQDQTLDEAHGCLSVEDNGPGLPHDVDGFAESSSMGLRLVNLLVRQLRGRLEILPSSGAHFRVSFPLNPR